MKNFLLKICVVLSLLSSPFRSDAVSADYTPTFYGVVNYNDMFWLASFEPEETATFNHIFYDYDLEANGSMFYAEGLLYSHWLVYNPYGSIDKTMQYIYDTKTHKKIETRELTSESAGFALTYDETQDCVYGYFQNPYATDMECYSFMRMNMHDGWPYELGFISIYEPVVVLAINSNGECYGVDYLGRFVKINKDNGKPSVIGSTGLVPAEIAQSACFDPITGKFYWAAYPEEGTVGLYEINIETGAATLISKFEDNEYVMGLYIPYPEPTAQSPAEVTEMEVNFEKTSLEGNVKFRAPSTTVGGETITAPFKAYVFLDTVTEVLDVEPGQEYVVDMSVQTNQMYNCRVWTMIDDNRSAKHTVTKWIGADYPKAPTNLQVFEEDGKVVFTWDTPPATGLHEGYVNTEEITYIISRNSFYVSGYVGNRYEEELPSTMTSYQFYIRSSYNDLNGGYAYSPNVTFGDAYDVPLTLGFLDNFELFTVIDANDDDNTWNAGWVSVDYTSNSNTADDWLITPKVNLKNGYKYEITINAAAQKYFYDELLEIFYGQGLTIADMTNKIGDITVSMLNDSNDYQLSFVCNETGQYNFGFHCVSQSGYNLKMYSFKIIEGDKVGIDEIKVNKTDNNYYDLMGRKVVNPQHGSIYINKGKLIKY